ncbi:hypothetical protein BH11PSE11_BH11PSE11_09680 [soil metagenome]
MTPATRLTMASGGRASEREAAISNAIAGLSDPAKTIAIVLEGMPDGSGRLEDLAGSTRNGQIAIPIRIAPGCLCCTGNLILRVTLNRILRHPPDFLYISVATNTHLEQLRAFLGAPPYEKLLLITKDIQV